MTFKVFRANRLVCLVTYDRNLEPTVPTVYYDLVKLCGWFCDITVQNT